MVGERAGGGGPFPWGTFIVNISGAALLGRLAGAAVTGNALILAGTATLGSYTTLSTWMLESHRLGQDDQLRVALANLLGIAGHRLRRRGARARRGSRAVNEDCLKLTAYFAERDRSGGRFLGDALLSICERHGLATSILLRGAEGFGRHQVLQTDRLLSLSEDLPMVLAAVDARPRIEAALPEIGAAAEHGLLTLERARLLSGRVGTLALPEELHDASKLTIYCGRHERVGRRPAFVAIVDLLHRHGLLSATVLLGVDGTVHGVRERARFFAANAQVPLMIIAVGPGAQLSPVLPEVAGLLERPLLTLERVRICKVDGERLAEPHPRPGPTTPGSGPGSS